MSQETKIKSSLDFMAGIVLFCFFCSGMTGLIYEILWSRMIVAIVGCAPFAVSII